MLTNIMYSKLYTIHSTKPTHPGRCLVYFKHQAQGLGSNQYILKSTRLGARNVEDKAANEEPLVSLCHLMTRFYFSAVRPVLVGSDKERKKTDIGVIYLLY